MLHPPLDVPEKVARVHRIPATIELLGYGAKLNDKVAGEVLRFGFAALLTPEAEEKLFIVAHNDAGIGAADEAAPVDRLGPRYHANLPAMSSAARWMMPVTSETRSEKMAFVSRRSSPPGTFSEASSSAAVT